MTVGYRVRRVEKPEYQYIKVTERGRIRVLNGNRLVETENQRGYDYTRIRVFEDGYRMMETFDR